MINERDVSDYDHSSEARTVFTVMGIERVKVSLFSRIIPASCTVSS